MIIDGKKIAQTILEKLKQEVSYLNFQPVFCDILVGEDKASAQYVEMKGRTAEKIGIKVHKAAFPSSISTEQLLIEINGLNRLKNMCGLIVQLPLPATINKDVVLNAIAPEIDVDATGKINSEKFYSGQAGVLKFPTAAAVMAMLDSLKLDFTNKKFLVLGQGQLVGTPVSYLIKQRGWQVDIARRSTPNIPELLKNADVVVSATGSAASIKGEMLKPACVVVDAGTSESQGGVAGDIEFESVSKVASYLSPVPGGVGPLTVAMLLSNVVQVAKSK